MSEETELGRWSRDGTMIYALEETIDRRGKPVLCNRWAAHIHGGPNATTEELEAVAARMAAADDLLRALRRLSGVLRNIPDDPEFPTNGVIHALAEAELAIDRATIRKGGET